MEPGWGYANAADETVRKRLPNSTHFDTQKRRLVSQWVSVKSYRPSGENVNSAFIYSLKAHSMRHNASQSKNDRIGFESR
jgi:hypothetical protein